MAKANTTAPEQEAPEAPEQEAPEAPEQEAPEAPEQAPLPVIESRIKCVNRPGLRIWLDSGVIMKPGDVETVPASEAEIYIAAGVAVYADN
jgi:hypothetical protein